MRVIEGEFRFVSESGGPVRPKPKASLWRRAADWLVRQPAFWLWVVMLTVVGLTEGLW